MSTKRIDKPREADFFSICGTCSFGCCNGVRPPLTQKRRRKIERYLKENHISINKPFIEGAYTFPRETPEGYCIFFDKTLKRCQIHPVKPETCVAGPYTFDINRATQKIEWFLKKETICPLAGQLRNNRQANGKHMKSAKLELRQLIRDLDAEALRAVLTVVEPETVNVGADNLAPDVLVKLQGSAQGLKVEGKT